jgi:Zn-dependent protease
MRATESIPNPAPAARHAVTALSVIAQIAALVFWTRWAVLLHIPNPHSFRWIIAVAIACMATTLVHECSHPVLAWCFEMGLLSFRAGPFHAVRREGRWHFKFDAAGLIAPGSSVVAVPTNPAQPRWEEIVMIAAGPAANLLVGSAAIWAVLHDTWASYQQTWEIVAYTGTFCLISAAVNLIPFLCEDGGYSDGARMLQILTRSPLDDFHRAIASVASTTITPRRYRDLDISQIERAAMLFPSDIRGLQLLLCACQYYEECGQLPEAAAALAAAETIYSNYSIDLPGSLHPVFVIGHAWLNRDAAAARLWWDRMEAKEHDHIHVDCLLAKAALFWIEEHPQQAEKAWQEAKAVAERLPSFGAFEFDRLLCTLLRDAFQPPSEAPSPAPAPVAAVPALAPSPLSAGVPAAAPIVAAIPACSPTPAPAAVRAPAPTLVIPRPSDVAPAPRVAAVPPPPPSAPGVAEASAALLPPPVAAVSTLALPPPPVAVAPLPPPAPVFATTLALMAVTPPPIAVSPVAIAKPEPAPTRPIETVIPATVAASDQVAVPDPMDPVAARIGALVRPVAKPVPSAPAVATGVDPMAGSATRIPVEALKPAPARITRAVDLPKATATTPPKPNAPAVPAAFARRPRPAPLPPGTAPDPFLAFQTPAPATPQAPETPITEASVVPEIIPNPPAGASTLAPLQPSIELVSIGAHQAHSEVPDPPAPEKPPRFDPFDFIRTAAIENLSANAS